MLAKVSSPQQWSPRLCASALANTVVHEVQNGSALLINCLVRAVRDGLTLVALVAYLLYLNWKLSLVVAIILPPLGLMIRVLTRRMYRLTQQTQHDFTV